MEVQKWEVMNLAELYDRRGVDISPLIELIEKIYGSFGEWKRLPADHEVGERLAVSYHYLASEMEEVEGLVAEKIKRGLEQSRFLN